MSRVVVIGGGPAGMMAAVTAAQNGNQVLLLEKNEVCGKKLSITGKGRCNVTNACDANEFIEHIVSNGRFLYSAIHAFSADDTRLFFENNGVPLKVERGKRVFPESDKAFDIVLAMRKAMKNAGVAVVHDKACHIIAEDGAVKGVQGKEKTYPCDAVILATGGKSYPLTGSTGDGYLLASEVGHSVTKLIPSLVPVTTAETAFYDLSGLSLKNVSLTVETAEGKEIYKDFGEMLFTHFGLSGPIVLSASAHIPPDTKVRFVLDLKPALTKEQLDARLIREFDAQKNVQLKNIMRNLLPSALATVFCDACKFDKETPANAVTKEQRMMLVETLKRLVFTVTGFRPFEEAIVTRGGITVTEVNPKTMESKLVSGLYFAGEVLDLDAYTGGFNLQIAFSTGYLAGNSIY